MTITTRRVTGPIVLPDGTVPRNGRVTYQLSGWDREGGEAVVMGPITVNLDGDGVFDDTLWCTDAGENGRVYVGTVQWHDGTARQSLPITFDVQSGAGDQSFVPSWVVGDLPESTQADALAQCLAAAAGAAGSAAAADASADATIAIGSADAFLRFGDVISDPLLGTDANWQITGATATRAKNKVYPVGKTISVSVPAATTVYLKSSTATTLWVGTTGLTKYVAEIDFTVTTGDLGTMYARMDWNTTTGEFTSGPFYLSDCLTRPFVVGQVMRARVHFTRPAGFTGTFASHEIFVGIGRTTDAARAIEVHRIAVQTVTAEDITGGRAPNKALARLADLPDIGSQGYLAHDNGRGGNTVVAEQNGLLVVRGSATTPDTATRYAKTALFAELHTSAAISASQSVWGNPYKVGALTAEAVAETGFAGELNGINSRAYSAAPAYTGDAAKRILVGLSAIGQTNPGAGVAAHDVFGINAIAAQTSGNSPANIVGIEADLVHSSTSVGLLPGDTGATNFTAFWAQSDASGGGQSDTAFLATHTAQSGGWRQILQARGKINGWMVYLETEINEPHARGIHVKTMWQGTGSRLMELFADTHEQFRVEGDSTNAVWARIGGSLKKLEVGATDSGGTGYRMVRVAN